MTEAQTSLPTSDVRPVSQVTDVEIQRAWPRSPFRVRQSDLKTWSDCPLKFRWEKVDGLQRQANGSRVFGSIMHDCVLYLETTKDLSGAIARFERFWRNPHLWNSDPNEFRIDYYVRGTSWVKFNDKGPDILRHWWDIIEWESDAVLAREHYFEVPIGNGHLLTGTVDKLIVRWHAATEQWIVLISDYKGLALDTRLPTPTGWTTMGEVQVGDRLIGGDGLPCRVTGKSEVHGRDCYRITFDDGSSIVADNEHLWQVETDFGTKILATEELVGNLVNPATGQRQLRIPNAATRLPEADLLLDPYVLGAWLGDGSRGTGVITKPLPALFEHIASRGFDAGPTLGHSGRTVYGLRPLLRAVGVLYDKHIPQDYLRASYAQRLDLMRGIMDTDGYWNKTRKRCVLNTTDERFARQTAELAASLGWKPTVFATTATGFGKTVPAWQTWFTPVDEEVFLARRPDGYYRRIAPAKSRRRLIVSVEPVLTVPTQCVMVDSPGNTYLCGDQMVVTHNTNNKTPTYDYLAEDLQFSAYAYASTRPEFWVSIEQRLGLEPGSLWERYKNFARYGEWVQLTSWRRMDAGIREERHYNRLIMAVNDLVRSIQHRIFVPNISGESCRYCDFRAQCGLPELMDDQEEEQEQGWIPPLPTP